MRRQGQVVLTRIAKLKMEKKKKNLTAGSCTWHLAIPFVEHPRAAVTNPASPYLLPPSTHPSSSLATALFSNPQPETPLSPVLPPHTFPALDSPTTRTKPKPKTMAPPTRTTPAAIPLAPVLPLPQLTTGALLCTISLISSTAARPLAIQLPKIQLPKISLPNLPNIDLPLPKLPDIDLPNFGKKKDNTPKKPAARSPPPKSKAPAGKIKVRASGNAGSSGSKTAPTLADLRGQGKAEATRTGEGAWKRFPSRRMPGANMDGWKQIAKQVKPNK